MSAISLVAVALLACGGPSLALSSPPKFNNSKCPSFWELQAPHVATDFTLDDFTGNYFELAFHDVTQRPLCPDSKPRCITSDKAVQTHADGVRFVNDTWNLQCFGAQYPEALYFNETEHPGYVIGYLPVFKVPFLPKGVVAGMKFPDTVVDFKAGPDGWVIELQCVEAFNHVMFVGINYYSKVNSEAAFQEMHTAAMARGLGLWVDSWPWGLQRVNFTGCPGNNASAAGPTAVIV